MIRGAIFDLDGTLLDSMFIWDTAGEAYLRSLGYEPKENLNETFKAMSLYQAACYCKKEYGISLTVEEMMNGVNAMIEHYYMDEAVLKPGAKAFLKQLLEKGVSMCIATATDRYLVEAALARCGVSAWFSEIFTCTAVGQGKDNPAIYRKALSHLQTGKEKTVVFEDALYAIKTAKADGFITAAVYDPYEKKQEDVKRLADCYIIDYRDTNNFWKLAESL